MELPTPMPMRVLIFEPQFMGHNLAHAGWLARGIEGLGCEAVLATSKQAVESEEFALHVRPVSDRIVLHPMAGFRTDSIGRRVRTGGLKGAVTMYRALTSAIGATRPDHVYVPHGNLLARVAPLPFGLQSALQCCGAEAETLLVSGRFLRADPSLAGRMRKRLMLETIARGPWTSVFHMDDAAHDHFQKHGGRMAEIGRRMPDCYDQQATDSRAASRLALNLPATGRAVAVVGLIERRKGVVPLMKALRATAADLRPDDQLWLAGSFHPEIRELIAGEYADLVAAGRVVCLDRRLSGKDFGRVIRAADVVATVYPSHPYTSGIVVAAAAAQRPLLGSDRGWIGRTIQRFELGRVCKAADPQNVAQQLVAALDASGTYCLTPAGQRFIEYSSRENFIAHWTARLRERLGLGPSPDLRSWEWATGEVMRQAA